MRHREIKAKIKEDLRNRANMGNKCPVFEAWEHKKYLRKNWISSMNFSDSEHLLVSAKGEIIVSRNYRMPIYPVYGTFNIEYLDPGP